jgi:hypothetical protein
MILNFPAEHRGLTNSQILELKNVYDNIRKRLDVEYNRIIESGILQYENCKLVLTGLHNLLRNTIPYHKDYKKILLNIKGRERELEYHKNTVFRIYIPLYDSEEFRERKTQEYFELNDLYRLYSQVE